MREGLHPVRWAREWASSGRLSKPEGDVLKELASYAGDAPVAWPSNDTIATATQYVDKTVKVALGGLEAKGLIVRERDLVGRVLRSREHPIVMVTALVATPAQGQMQLELGDQALVTADPQPRRRTAPTPLPVDPPAVEDELAQRRAKIAADAAQVGAALHELNASAVVASDDPGLPTTRGEGRQETPEVPGKVHMELQEEESVRERTPDPISAVPAGGGVPATFSAVMDELRHPEAFGPGVDLFDASIAQVLRAHPEPDGFDHLAAGRMLIAEQHTATAMGWRPIAVPSLKLAAILAKQRGPQRAPAGRPATRRRGDQGHEQPAASRPKRFVQTRSVEEPIFG